TPFEVIADLKVTEASNLLSDLNGHQRGAPGSETCVGRLPYRWRRGSLEDLLLRPVVLDCGQEDLRIAGELLQYMQSVCQPHNRHELPGLALLNHIFEHLRARV